MEDVSGGRGWRGGERVRDCTVWEQAPVCGRLWEAVLYDWDVGTGQVAGDKLTRLAEGSGALGSSTMDDRLWGEGQGRALKPRSALHARAAWAWAGVRLSTREGRGGACAWGGTDNSASVSFCYCGIYPCSLPPPRCGV